MSDKEKKKFKKISKRLLSSFRKGRKLHEIKEHPSQVLPECSNFGNVLTDSQPDNLQAAISLDSPVKQEVTALSEISFDFNSINSESHKTSMQNERISFSNLRSARRDHQNFSSPRVRRVDLGGPMSASTDSGIDCSLLLSEKGSPEQFVVFTRREAERIRQENINSHNESVLETLNEVDRISSEDNEDESLSREELESVSEIKAEGRETVNLNRPNGNTLQKQIDQTKEKIDLLSELRTALSEKLTLCESDSEGSNENRSDGECVEITHDQSMKSSSGIFRDISNASIITRCDDNQDEKKHFDMNTTLVDNYFLDLYANKTDETKTEEARLKRENESVGMEENVLQIDSPHGIISPIPVQSTSSIANHRTLPSTPSPARLLVNENSAFAKCKSIKRSVSDVGKGILGKFRHKRKDIDSTIMSRDDSFAVDRKVSISTRKFVKSKLKKMAVNRKLKSSTAGVNNSLHVVDLNSSVLQGSREMFENNTQQNFIKSVSPVSKEVLPHVNHAAELPVNSSVHDVSSAWSPILKEDLSETDSSKLQERIEHTSPVINESIHDLTRSICEMTSDLFESQRSSAESIACICNCKNKNSDTECCDKRKTPSPLTETECNSGVNYTCRSDSISNNAVENSNKSCVSDQLLNKTETNDEPLADKSVMCNSVFVDCFDNDYTDDETEDDEEECCGEDCDCSDGDCSDLSCSDCCHNPDGRTKNTCSSGSSSESESDAGRCSAQLDNRSISCRRESADGSFSRCADPVSSSSSASSSVSTPTKDKFLNQNQSFNVEKSPYSVSFQEIDFENGDVMYVENSFCDNYFNNSVLEDDHTPSPYSQYSTFGKTPASSPMDTSGTSLQASLSPLNLSQNHMSTSDSCTSLNRNQSINLVNASPKPLNLSQHSRFASESPTQMNESQNSSFMNMNFESCRRKNNYYDFQKELDYNSLNSGCNWTAAEHRQKNMHLTEDQQDSVNISYLSESHLNGSFLNNSKLRRSISHANSSPNRRQNGSSLNRSHSHVTSLNASLNRSILHNTSLQEVFPSTPPLDLSMSRKRSPISPSSRNKQDKWMDRHLGQVYSPAKRVLQKNRGLSETDLCRQILDLYVSDAEESGFDMDNSYMDTTVSDLPVRGGVSSRVDDSILQYGTYVAPRHTVRETNVDDFSTTTVRKCYTGEARTRRLQGGNCNNVSLRAEDRRRAALKELKGVNQSYVKDTSLSDALNSSVCVNDSLSSSPPRKQTRSKLVKHARHVTYSKDKQPGRSALRDKTNTTRRLSSLEMPPSLTKDMKPDSFQDEIQKEKGNVTVLCEKSFDRLTLLHTAKNGQRKVRCLSMNESQNVIKHYPPPREATRISWGQTLSEMDLYRHTPKKTPVKTKPILTQSENNFPYDDDTPSPIVLTKMRKPKSLSKKYKNWPWS